MGLGAGCLGQTVGKEWSVVAAAVYLDKGTRNIDAALFVADGRCARADPIFSACGPILEWLRAVYDGWRTIIFAESLHCFV